MKPQKNIPMNQYQGTPIVRDKENIGMNIEKNKLEDPTSIVIFDLESKRQGVLRNPDKQSLDVMISIGSKDVEIEHQRVGLDLVFVVDVSGSMKGEKIQLVRETLDFVIGELEPMDRVAIVTFDDKAEVISPLSAMTPTGKKNLQAQIKKKIKERGSTNINAGMNAAFQLLLNRSEVNEMTSIFLLSDGADTCGNTASSFKQNLTYYDGLMNQKGMSYKINSFGYGKDHDEKVLGLYSSFKEGNFYYIKNPQIVDECFIECLGYLMSVFASEAEITVYLSGSNTFEKKYGTNWSQELNNSKSTLKIGTLAVGIEKNFIAKIQIPPTFDAAQIEVCFAILTFVSGKKSYNLRANLILPIVDFSQLGPINKKLEQNLARLEAAEVMEKAQFEYKKGNIKIARECLLVYKVALKEKKELDVDFVNHIDQLCDENELGDDKGGMEVNEMLQAQAYKPSRSNFATTNMVQKKMMARKKMMN